VLSAARIEAEEADDWRESSLADDYRAQAMAPLSGEMIAHVNRRSASCLQATVRVQPM
jgi:hypothetical protein